MFLPTTPFHLHGNSSKAQRGEIGIKMTGAHRQIPRLNRVLKRQNIQPWHLHLPAGWSDSPHAEWIISTTHRKAVQMLYVIANGVGARCPDRQLNNDALGFRPAGLTDLNGLA